MRAGSGHFFSRRSRTSIPTADTRGQPETRGGNEIVSIDAIRDAEGQLSAEPSAAETRRRILTGSGARLIVQSLGVVRREYSRPEGGGIRRVEECGLERKRSRSLFEIASGWNGRRCGESRGAPAARASDPASRGRGQDRDEPRRWMRIRHLISCVGVYLSRDFS